MATIGDAILGAINTNWAVPTGGVKPTLANTEDVRFDYPDVTEIVIALSYTLYTRVERVNDTYVDRFHTITLQAQTTDATDMEERLIEIVDEVDRILNTNGVTGFTTVKIMKKEYTPSDRSRGIYACNMHIELIERNTSSATAAGSTSTMDISALTMYGSANKTWVPCSLFSVNDFSYVSWSGGALSNTGANDYTASFKTPLSVLKGTHKLYIDAYRFIVRDADATNYISASYLYGFDSSGTNTLLASDGTDYNSIATWTKTFTTVDCSSHSGIFIYYTTTLADANALDIQGIQVRAYYA